VEFLQLFSITTKTFPNPTRSSSIWTERLFLSQNLLNCFFAAMAESSKSRTHSTMTQEGVTTNSHKVNDFVAESNDDFSRGSFRGRRAIDRHDHLKRNVKLQASKRSSPVQDDDTTIEDDEVVGDVADTTTAQGLSALRVLLHELTILQKLQLVIFHRSSFKESSPVTTQPTTATTTATLSRSRRTSLSLPRNLPRWTTARA